MAAMTLDLPTGSRGRLLALSLTALALLVLWFGIASPVLGWYQDRTEQLNQREMLARRMAGLAAARPELERQAAGLTASSAAPNALLAGETDAVAAATLQERMQDMAGKAGAQLSSVEMLPAAQAGQFRRIGLRVAVQAGMTNVIHLLELIEQATPRMLIDELDLQRRLLLTRPNAPDLDARFIVYAFRAGQPGGKPR